MAPQTGLSAPLTLPSPPRPARGEGKVGEVLREILFRGNDKIAAVMRREFLLNSSSASQGVARVEFLSAPCLGLCRDFVPQSEEGEDTMSWNVGCR